MNSIGETTLVIDLSALEHNYRYLRSKIHKSTKFMAVVKAFAYGSDMVAIAKKCEALGIDYLAVAYVNEGVLLRKAGITLPILVLHPLPIHFERAMAHQLEPSLYSSRVLRLFLNTARQLRKKQYSVHLKFNTGLNRLGFWENDIDNIERQLKNDETLYVKGILSHLAASEDAQERDFTLGQIRSFDKTAHQLEKLLGYRPLRHLLNTSGIMNYPEAQYEMVRSGIALYGFGNNRTIDAELKPVATLKTVISQRHNIEPNESVGYNRAFVADDYKTIATLPIGHADGIGRHYGAGTTHVVINGKKAPIVGNVCMDMIMVDVTQIDCKAGDEVTIFGPGHSAEDFASSGQTISYELLTAISQRVKRVVKA